MMSGNGGGLVPRGQMLDLVIHDDVVASSDRNGKWRTTTPTQDTRRRRGGLRVRRGRKWTGGLGEGRGGIKRRSGDEEQRTRRQKK